MDHASQGFSAQRRSARRRIRGRSGTAWSRAAALACAATLLGTAAGAGAAQSDWPSYNRTLTSNRYSPLAQINTGNVARLELLCSYDSGQQGGFQTGLVQVDGALFGTTAQDTFSIDPNTCRRNWQAHEDIAQGVLKVNRGVAVADGRVIRGTADGRVLAYDEKTGQRLWATTIADPSKGESVPAAPIAWQGMVFIGNAGGDDKGVKGRMYALDAASGRILWEFYLVPRQPGDIERGPQAKDAPYGVAAASWTNTQGFPISGGATWTSYTLDPASGLLYVPGGNPSPDFTNAYRKGDNLFSDTVVVLDARTGAYQRHFQIARNDFHDWDESTAPALFTTRSGRHMMAVAPKDGHLYGFDLDARRQLYRKPVTTMFNETAALTPQGTRFCPGTQGGAEWNGPAYDALHDTLLTGEVDWCTTVHTESKDTVKDASFGQPWSGSKDGFGLLDKPPHWAGWLTASDVTTGAKKWQFKAPFPVLGGVTPTAGSIVLFADMGGNFYAFDSADGKRLWSTKLPGAVGGGIITYDTGAGQRIAVADGMASPIWPTSKITGRIMVFGLR
ncbi:MAG TPA: PQQ-binding-like beta-propeller repeat protein [Steroidobacteraceae bacterium]|jgi:glucose dehydrogenase|nr:PQQ-binding-like beta-propeller repeat protein [Steroidobacteraceae bacterium]